MRFGSDEVGGVLGAVGAWLDGQAPEPARAALARAVRLSLRALAQAAPGATVEVRVPPFAAVQCVAELATGRVTWPEAIAEGRVAASGSRADVSAWLPLTRPPQ